MKIHEYQGKEIFRRFGVPVPRGIPAFSVDDAVKAAQTLGGPVWVVKAQIHAGGRGKGGGVKLARSIDEVKQRAAEILGMQLVTHQTGAAGQKVRRLLIEEGADIAKELYVGMVVDRATQRVTLMASSEGGMDIEEVAAHTPEKIHKVHVDPALGMTDAEADDIAVEDRRARGQRAAGARGAAGPVQGVLGDRCVAGRDQSADPHRRTAAWSRSTPRSTSTPTRCSAIRTSSRCATSTRKTRPRSRRASSTSATSSSTATSAAWSTARAWRWRRWTRSSSSAASRPTSSTSAAAPPPRRSTEAFKLMLRNPGLKAILVNIFGGIMKCDTIAEGVIVASRAVDLKVPLVVRMKGTNEEIGKKMLKDSGLPIISADTMAEAAEKVVAAASGR